MNEIFYKIELNKVDGFHNEDYETLIDHINDEDLYPFFVKIIQINDSPYFINYLNKQEMKDFLKIINDDKYALLFYKHHILKYASDVKLKYFRNKSIPIDKESKLTLKQVEELIYE